VSGLYSTDSGFSPVVGFYNHHDETSDSAKVEKFLNS